MSPGGTFRNSEAFSEETLMSLGKTIAKFRKEKGLTQVELAKELGVHQSHITRWESDRVRPREGTLQKLASSLDSSVEELLVGGKEALASSFNIDDPELVELLSDIPKLEDEEVGALKILLKGLMSRIRVREALQ